METMQLSLFMILWLGVHRSSSDILQRQKRNWIIDSFTIDEGYDGSYPYILGKIDITKNLTIFKLRGQGVNEEPTGILQINKYTGEITVHGPVDHEKYKVFKLTFQAVDSQSHVIDTQLGVEIKIIDSNDNPPKFTFERYEISIKESTSQGTDLITVQANDVDSNSNGRFDLKLMSVNPKQQDLEFNLKHIPGTQTGTISFKGCLDREKSAQYTIIVEAKDRGEKKSLSSSCTIIVNIENGNNHIPEIIGQTGPGRVKEGEENVLVTRLQVTDKDTRGTAAWRAKYQIHGDPNKIFRITTDPETNEGLLYVDKHLDYETSPMTNVSITVENEIPYHTCKVVSRRGSGLWEVVTKTGGMTGTETLRQSTRHVTVTVEDVNEPPIFDKSNKQVTLGENVEPGKYLETFTASDPETNTFVYIKGEDPADWVTVNQVTGQITTTKKVDRESSFVKDNIYKVTVYAVDKGAPSQTGTATLNIHVTDENDNAPSLTVSTIDMCQSDGPSVAKITAVDLDEEPYSGPFTFKVLGEEGKWRVDPQQGHSVNLVKEHTVHSGYFDVLLEVSDLQGNTAVRNLSVTVCNCLDIERPNCRTRKATGTAVAGGTVGIIFFGILLLAGMLLLALLLTCKKKTIEIPEEGSGQHLMKCNTESPGTQGTYKGAFEPLNQGNGTNGEQIQKIAQASAVQVKQSYIKTTAAEPQALSQYGTSQTEQQQRNYSHRGQTLTTGASQAQSEYFQFQRKSSMEQNLTHGNSMRLSMGAASTTRTTLQLKNSMRRSSTRRQTYSADQETAVMQRGFLLKILNKMLNTLQAPGEELGDYGPHVYREEGDTQTMYELDAISIPDTFFDPDSDLDLNFKFSNLASVCVPRESAAYSA